MSETIGYDALQDALRRCGSSWGAAATHGLLAGRLAIGGADGGFGWLQQVLLDTDPNDARRVECEASLSDLYATTHRQLAERLSEFEPLLPDDADTTAVRAEALASWCEGFLHGLVSAKHGDVLKNQLAAEPLADIIRDMLQITRASAGESDDAESDEQAYVELVEYVRVATQLAYEELASLRRQSESTESAAPVH